MNERRLSTYSCFDQPSMRVSPSVGNILGATPTGFHLFCLELGSFVWKTRQAAAHRVLSCSHKMAKSKTLVAGLCGGGVINRK